MEELLNKVLEQSIPKHAFKFIIGNIVVAFIVTITTLLLIIRGVAVDNAAHVDYLALGIFMIIGNIMLIITGIASIHDYRKDIRKHIEEVKKNQ